MIPPPATVTVWRTLISTSYLHPGILFHDDLSLLPELFLHMGAKLESQDSSIQLSSNESNPFGPPISPVIRPVIPEQEKFQIIFGEIEDCEVDPSQNRIIIRKYSLGKYIRRAVKDLVKFIRKCSESVYLPEYGFLYDFFVRCGVSPEQLSEYVNTATNAAAERHEMKKLNKAAGHNIYKICRKRHHKHGHRHRGSPSSSSSTGGMSPSPDRKPNALENLEKVDKIIVVASKSIKKVESIPENGRRLQLAQKRKTEGDFHSETGGRPINGLVTKKLKRKDGKERIHYQCPSCPLFFTRRGGVYQHFRNKHAGQPFPSLVITDSSRPTVNVRCEFCDNAFISISALSQHMKKKHPIEAASVLESWSSTPPPWDKLIPAAKSVAVPLPGSAAKSTPIPTDKDQGPSTNTTNMNADTESTGLFKCSLCGHALKTRSGLKYHWKHSHPKEMRNGGLFPSLPPKNQTVKKIKCPFCEWRIESKSGLRYHMKSKHNENEIAEKSLAITTIDPALDEIMDSSSSDVQTSQSSQESEQAPSDTLSPFGSPTPTPTASPAAVKKIPIVVKSISCPNCPVLFTTRNALLLHFRRKHPNQKPPARINSQGGLANLKPVGGKKVSLVNVKVQQPRALNHVLLPTPINSIPETLTLALDSNSNNINLMEIDEVPTVIATTEMDSHTATASTVREISFLPEVFTSLDDIMGSGKPEFIVPALDALSEYPDDEFERLLSSLETDEVTDD